jgi:anthranilate/para-aminobenzoate synthase component I
MKKDFEKIPEILALIRKEKKRNNYEEKEDRHTLTIHFEHRNFPFGVSKLFNHLINGDHFSCNLSIDFVFEGSTSSMFVSSV